MTDAIRILGVILVVFAVAFSAWPLVRTGTKESPKAGRISVGFLAGFLGVALIMQARITTLTTPIGTIQAATEQALADAGDVAKLKTQAENQTATINLVANEATKAKELSETVAKQVTEAENKLTDLDVATKSAQAALNNVREVEDFTMTVLAAQGDDRRSFDKLKSMAGDKNNRFAATAGQAWNSIFEAHSGPISQDFPSPPWKPDVDPSKLALEQLSNGYENAPYQIRPMLLKYIANRNDIPLQKRLDFLMVVMKSDQSLLAMEYAGRYFGQLSSQNIKAMALDYLSSWWNEHRHDFEGK